MADQETTTGEDAAKKKLPKKMLIIIGIVMLVEGAIFGAGYMLFGESPPSVEAKGNMEDDKAKDLDKVEVLLIGDKFQNTRQGAQAYLYDATIYVIVRRRHQTIVEDMIKANTARISSDITEIFARAEPAQLNEPDRNTLKRQILEKCRKTFGRVPGGGPKDGSDSDEKEKIRDKSNEDYYVLDVVISNWKRFSTDS